MLPSDDRATATCPECGTWQVVTGSYCTSCGAALAPTETGETGETRAAMHDSPTVRTPAWNAATAPPVPESAGASPTFAPPSTSAGPAVAQADAVGTDAPRAQADDPAALPMSIDESLRCQWCGTPNPDGVERCTQCGAAFPRPEQDEALLRASLERIRAATESLELMRRQRSRRGLGRWFDR